MEDHSNREQCLHFLEEMQLGYENADASSVRGAIGLYSGSGGPLASMIPVPVYEETNIL
jgi:hypothetical protein